jgi:rhodanese-related sulfurtransferase
MSKNKKFQSVKTLTPTEAVKLIKDHQNDAKFIILDVRTPWEFDKEHIDGAINMDFTDPDFNKMLEKLDKNKKYLIYCKSGVRSGKVLELIKKLDFTTVYNIKDGYEGWKSYKLKLND